VLTHYKQVQRSSRGELFEILG